MNFNINDKVIINNPVSALNGLSGTIVNIYPDEFKKKPDGSEIMLAEVNIDFPAKSSMKVVKEIFPIEFLKLDSIRETEYKQNNVNLGESYHVKKDPEWVVDISMKEDNPYTGHKFFPLEDFANDELGMYLEFQEKKDRLGNYHLTLFKLYGTIDQFTELFDKFPDLQSYITRAKIVDGLVTGDPSGKIKFLKQINSTNLGESSSNPEKEEEKYFTYDLNDEETRKRIVELIQEDLYEYAVKSDDYDILDIDRDKFDDDKKLKEEARKAALGYALFIIQNIKSINSINPINRVVDSGLERYPGLIGKYVIITTDNLKYYQDDEDNIESITSICEMGNTSLDKKDRSVKELLGIYKDTNLGEDLEKFNTLMDLASALDVNMPDHRGAPYPEFDKYKINEERFPDNIRCKYLDWRVFDDSDLPELVVYYTSQENFSESDANKLRDEILRCVKELVKKNKITQEFRLSVVASSRDKLSSYYDDTIINDRETNLGESKEHNATYIIKCKVFKDPYDPQNKELVDGYLSALYDSDISENYSYDSSSFYSIEYGVSFGIGSKKDLAVPFISDDDESGPSDIAKEIIKKVRNLDVVKFANFEEVNKDINLGEGNE